MSGITDGPKGIDVSKWQPTTPSLTGLDFLFARASIGTTTDPMYSTHIANARKAGLLVGAYHFNWSTLSVASQVKTFLAKAGDVDFYVIDVEYAGNGIKQFTRAQTQEFIDLVRAAGKKCGLYMSESSFYTDVDADFRWVANWSQPPSIRWAFWQYQGSPLDKNRFNGTLAELKALAGETEDMRPIPVTDQTPKLVSKRTKTNFYDLDGVTVVRTAPELTERLSPYEATNSAGDKYRAVYSASRVLLVKPSVIKDVPQPECPPTGDCSAVEAELAAKTATVNEQAAIIAAKETELVATKLRLANTYANIDALKA